MTALQRRARRAYGQAMSLAWHAAAFQRAKRLPSLTTVLQQIEDGPAARARRPRTPEEEQQQLVGRQMATFASLCHGT